MVVDRGGFLCPGECHHRYASPLAKGLLEFSITVLVDGDDTIQSFELECNAMPVPVALINWWGGLDVALAQAAALKDQLITAWDREISAGGEMP